MTWIVLSLDSALQPTQVVSLGTSEKRAREMAEQFSRERQAPYAIARMTHVVTVPPPKPMEPVWTELVQG